MTPPGSGGASKLPARLRSWRSRGSTLAVLSLVPLLVAGVAAAGAGLSGPERPTCAGHDMRSGDTCVTDHGDESYADAQASEHHALELATSVRNVAAPLGGGLLAGGILLALGCHLGLRRVAGGRGRRAGGTHDPLG
ncbi:hypothetical protein [Dactylosporangium sp. NPDC049140]|jgi:hypothetical protein|uniref:hypothetical protein n=1 Tax=Dactylosporangium sp. NPDC049140 TaxID=3155647 RepID=UPI0033F9CE43